MTTPDQLLDKMSELYDLMLCVADELRGRQIYDGAVQLAGMAGKVQGWMGEIRDAGEIEERENQQ